MQMPDGPYDHNEHEEDILASWLEQKLYKPETARSIIAEQLEQGVRSQSAVADTQAEQSESKKSRNIPRYTIINPPPNAYARPHMGNVSGYAYQDLFGRRARMQGHETLLFPGKDHAAQQAEIVYIRDVLTPQGKKKEDYTREQFYDEAYKYFTQIAEVAQKDEKRVGLSADFDRDLFTLDPRVSASVYRTFEKMWADKMVYKGVRIVNWSPGLNSAVADIDTDRQEVDSVMYYLKYALPQVDQDILSLREDFAGKEVEIEITELHTIDQASLGKDAPVELIKAIKLAQNKVSHVTASLTDISGNAVSVMLWIISDKELAAGEKLTVKFTGLVIPLSADGQLVAQVETAEFTTTAEDFIFKFANKLYGSAFIRQFSQDDAAPNNDYARGFILGTVRPETKFGDTAIAVNPEDKRFEQFIGKELQLISATGPVKIRIIADNSISMDFGTGMMKVTPAHSTTDYEIYLRHNAAHPEFTIGYKNIIGKDSRLNSLAGEFAGLHAETDRKKIADMMASKGLIVYQEQSKSNITLCERTKTVIQPMMSSQWFIDTDKLKAPAIEALQAGKVHIHPDYMTKKLEAWLEGLRDWPISRSIWWGYRIPVWYKGEVSEVTDEQGQLVVTIGGVGVKDMNEAVAKGLMKVDLREGYAPILIPGYRAPENASYYAQLKRNYPWAQMVHTGDKPQEYSDYKAAFDKINWSEDSVAVAHSLGASAIIQYLLEQKIKIKHLILLAPSNKSSQKFEQYKRDGFWQAETGGVAGAIAEQVSMIYSDDDEFYTQQQLEDFAEELGGGNSSVNLILEAGKKHFVTSDYNLGSVELERLLAQEASSHEKSQAASLKELAAQGWVQDEDVFDTWFSSGQWPVATLESEGLLDHYPTSLMETGFDILELWVSRMLMLGIYSLGEVPFRDVYLHGLIKGEDGQKMSKSKGNLVYTEDVIAEYGADTLRMLYIVGNKAGASYRVDSRKLKGYRNFLNKIWNASRFILSNLEGSSIDRNAHQQITAVLAGVELPVTGDNNNDNKDKKDDNQIPSLETFKAVAKEEVRQALAAQNAHPLAQKLDLEGADASMLIAMKEIETSVNLHLDNFRPGMAAEELIQHFWHVFADIYVEQVKGRLFQVDREGNPINRDAAAQESRNKALATLSYCGLSYLKLMHPFIPFITEKVWSYYPENLRESKSIMYAVWPGN